MQNLELIAAGEVDAVRARLILAELPRNLDLTGARKLFTALRAWTWKALDQKRRDAELREWHDVMKRAQVRAKGFGQVAAQLQVLLDLIHESIAVALRKPAADVLKLRHAKAVLACLRDAPASRCGKQELMAKFGLKDANASRLMNVLMGAGLVERVSDGREAHYRLSRLGQEHAVDLVAPRIADGHRPDPASDVRLYGISFVEGRTLEVQEQMVKLLNDKLRTQKGKKWIGSFDRCDFTMLAGSAKSVRRVGAAYYRDEHKLFGDPAEIARTMIVDRSEPPAYVPSASPKVTVAAGG